VKAQSREREDRTRKYGLASRIVEGIKGLDGRSKKADNKKDRKTTCCEKELGLFAIPVDQDLLFGLFNFSLHQCLLHIT